MDMRVVVNEISFRIHSMFTTVLTEPLYAGTRADFTSSTILAYWSRNTMYWSAPILLVLASTEYRDPTPTHQPTNYAHLSTNHQHTQDLKSIINL
jgi:hypothetical protein